MLRLNRFGFGLNKFRPEVNRFMSEVNKFRSELNLFMSKLNLFSFSRSGFRQKMNPLPPPFGAQDWGLSPTPLRRPCPAKRTAAWARSSSSVVPLPASLAKR